MMKDAERNAEADKKRREQIDAKNMADSLVYQAEKQLQDLGDKVVPEDRDRAEYLIKELREAIAKEESDRLKSLSDELQQTLMQIGNAMYANSNGENGTKSRS